MRNGGLAGGKIGGPASFAAQSKAASTDSDYLMADGTKPKNQREQTCSIGGRTDLKPEAKNAKKYHSNPENEDGFNSKWEEQAQRGSLQRKQALGQTGTGHMVQRMEEQLKQGPAGGFLEGLGAGRFEGYKLGYTGGLNTDADKDAIGRAATQPEVVDAKARCKKKLAVAKALNINSTYRIYKDKKGAFQQPFDTFFPPTAK
jgi:hypothetical protein